VKACSQAAGGGSGLTAGAAAQAEGSSRGWLRWYKREMRKQSGRMLAIGDGANDVAMIQVPLPRARAGGPTSSGGGGRRAPWQKL